MLAGTHVCARIQSVEEATQAPPTATPAPTQGPTPTPYVEERMLELEYPVQMHKGDSDVLRLSLMYTGEGYSVTTEFEDHTVDVQEVPLEYVPGYQLAAAARLDGGGFYRFAGGRAGANGSAGGRRDLALEH